MVDGRFTSDDMDALVSGSTREARTTNDQAHALGVGSTREARYTDDIVHALVSTAPPALESRLTQLGVIVWSEPAAPPAAPTYSGIPEVQGASARAVRVQGAAPIVVVQGTSAGARRVTGGNAS